MDLSCLLSLIEQQPAYHDLLGRLKKEPAAAPGMPPEVVALEAARPYLVASIYRQLGIPFVVVTGDYEKARQWQEQLQAWSGATVRFFPEPEPSDGEEDGIMNETALERIRTLSALASCPDEGAAQLLVVVPVLAAISPVATRADFNTNCVRIHTGMATDPVQLIAQLQGLGYDVESTVEVPGTVSRRGGIVDVYSPHDQYPARIEFFGNKIESMRLFDPKTQRSLKPVQEVTVVPARDTAAGSADTLLDYLPESCLLIVDGPEEIKGFLDDESWAKFEAKANARPRRLVMASWSAETPGELPFKAVPFWGGNLDAFVEALGYMLRDSVRTIIVSHQARRLSEYLLEHDILAAPVEELCEVPPPGSLTLVHASLPEGWSLSGDFRVLTDKEIFGFVKQRRQVQKRPVHWQQFLAQLSPGDFVVHVDHGVGRFTGFVKQGVPGAEREFLVLEYASADKLYVPVDRIDRVSRYVGADEQPPAMNRLGTQEWARTKAKVRKAVEEIAQDLLKLYAIREATPGHAFSPDTLWQQEMEASFPYVETPDQLEAVGAVKEDMEKPRAMDRLICGDVGYGKTEVALRGAFKAVMDGKQVAILVPTTILAQQHYLTFKERLQTYPLKVAMLSRFCSEKEQDDIVAALAAGSVDICIGTHRLLQKDIQFKDLGLVIIDEEQRFGVAHKERLRQMRQNVDVLTLSATPIPRTLYMSLVGVKDMSTIETPPDERLAIKTYVGQFKEDLVRHAIQHEIGRGGQVFVVHNRVHTIGGVADRVKQLVPQARISVGHGQMPEDQLERIMVDFASGKSDVLVSTTIIESGLDMPNVNTLIVTDSDRLGLTQLHQLRGRVGRGVNRAQAYFLYPPDKRLTLQASKRLRTIFEFTELGSGFGIALKDLEIRGAGNLLGVEQSGHIAAVGFDLYCRLLGEAVADLKATGATAAVARPAELPPAELPLKAFIPADYIEDANARVSLYYRLARLESPEAAAEVRQELTDRFGKLPQPVENLLYIMETRLLAKKAGVASIKLDKDMATLQLTDDRKTRKFTVRAERYRGRLRLGFGQVRLDIRNLREGWQAMLKDLLGELAG